MILLFGVQKEIRSIMKKPLGTRDVELRQLAKRYGCSLASSYTQEGKHLEEEIIRRIQEAARSNQESFLWLIAFISAAASVISALAAWAAIALRT